MTHTCREAIWIHLLLSEFEVITHTPIPFISVVIILRLCTLHVIRCFIKERSMLEWICHLVKHHFLAGFILFKYVSFINQGADVLTKCLAFEHLTRLCSTLSVSHTLQSLLVVLKMTVIPAEASCSIVSVCYV